MRVLLSAESPPITEIIETGVVNRMVEILQEPMNPANEQLMFETVWALTNIACGTSEAVQTLVDAGVIGIILKAIDFEGEFDTFGATKKDLLTQAIWLLGNVTGDSKTMRDMMLNTGFVENHLIRLSTSEIPVVLARNLAFTFSNCVRGPPVHHSVSFSVVKGILELMGRHHDQEMLLDCIWGLYYASAKGDEVVLDHFVSIGVVDFLSQWMFTNVKEVKTVALKLVASFIQALISFIVIIFIRWLLSSAAPRTSTRSSCSIMVFSIVRTKYSMKPRKKQSAKRFCGCSRTWRLDR
jgi:hypothetical protein